MFEVRSPKKLTPSESIKRRRTQIMDKIFSSDCPLCTRGKMDVVDEKMTVKIVALCVCVCVILIRRFFKAKIKTASIGICVSVSCVFSNNSLPPPL